jgi:predicted Zn-dependent protease with MMP-like domain
VVPEGPARHTAVVEIADDAFEDLVAEELDRLPPELLAMADNVVVLIADGHDEGLLGLYEGVPHIDRGQYGFGDLPDRVTLYRRPLCESVDSEEELRHEIHVTLVHELAHHVGIDDDRLDELGWA